MNNMSLRTVLKRMLTNNTKSSKIICSLYNKTIGRNSKKIVGSNNRILCQNAILINTRIIIIGDRNKVIIEDMAILRYTKLYIRGNDNTIHIHRDCRFTNTEFWIEDDNNFISVGKKTTIYGFTHLACIEGNTIEIGEDCLFSTDVIFRTGDSHVIVNSLGNRINPSRSIVIGNHVWFSNKTTILKGAVISDNTVVGTGAIVTKPFNQNNCILAGNPAKVIKEDINWLRERY